MIKLPHWAISPKVKHGKVVATERGWVVIKPNGKEEVLKAVRGLPKLIDELNEELRNSIIAVDEPDVVSLGDLDVDLGDDEQINEPVVDSEPVVEPEPEPVVEPKKKGRGRPKKVKTKPVVEPKQDEE